jgi:hypothetical protein
VENYAFGCRISRSYHQCISKLFNVFIMPRVVKALGSRISHRRSKVVQRFLQPNPDLPKQLSGSALSIVSQVKKQRDGWVGGGFNIGRSSQFK